MSTCHEYQFGPDAEKTTILDSSLEFQGSTIEHVLLFSFFSVQGILMNILCDGVPKFTSVFLWTGPGVLIPKG